ncbi:hypothetical protein F5Y01DRAFT_319343 [Xylaria sp. FL0043]|nr:hypothetical protein F5Y01DRAFT_319343 [Xylaria sp. FL0043]
MCPGHRICTEADRQVFEQIARHPLRAQYVKEILYEDFYSIDRSVRRDFALGRHRTGPPEENPFGDFSNLWENLYEQLSMGWLIAGTSGMQNLRAVIGRPARCYRRIPFGSYEIQSEQYRCQIMNCSYSYKPGPLGVEMEHPVRHSPHWHQALTLVRDGDITLNAVDTRAFQHLTTIDIWVFRSRSSLLTQSLQAAKGLMDLKLRFRDRFEYSGNPPLEDWRHPFLKTLLDATHWPSLHSFYMSRGLTMPAIANLGSQLRYLTLNDCQATYGFLTQVRAQQTFPQLQSIAIRCRDDDRIVHKLPVTQAGVLAYVRQEIRYLKSTKPIKRRNPPKKDLEVDMEDLPRDNE